MLFWPIRADRINQTTLWESKMMLERSSQLLAELYSVMHHEDFPIQPGSARSTTECTVGVMLNGLTIYEVIVGGPAFNCRQLLVGDKILKVDGIAVNALTIHAALEGGTFDGLPTRGRSRGDCFAAANDVHRNGRQSEDV